MIAYRNVYDSWQLAHLRIEFSRANPGTQVTAGRLGAYARERDIRIDDLGAHSKRWVEAFERGRFGSPRSGVGSPSEWRRIDFGRKTGLRYAAASRIIQSLT